MERGRISVTKRFSFCYGHYLPGYKGKCANQHGHNATLEVEVAGDSGEYDGMVMDFASLKAHVAPVLEELDHQNINGVLRVNPTAENMAAWIAQRVEQRLPVGVVLLRVSVSETDTSWAHWRRVA